MLRLVAELGLVLFTARGWLSLRVYALNLAASLRVATLSVALLLAQVPLPQTVEAGPDPMLAALDLYEKEVRKKLDSDLESIARGFSDTRDLRTARRLADLLKPLLESTNLALGRLHVLANPDSLIGDLLHPKSTLDLALTISSYQSLYSAGKNFYRAVTGPEYEASVSAMLTEADSTLDSTAYKNTILEYLYGLNGKRSAVQLVIKDGVQTRTVTGVKDFKATLNSLLGEIRRNISNRPRLSDTDTATYVAAINAMRKRILLSKSHSVEIDNGFVLGRVNTLEQLRIRALANYDLGLKGEQVSTITGALGSICVVITYYAPAFTTVGDASCTYIKGLALADKMAGQTATAILGTDARKDVDEVPLRMLLALPEETQNLWSATRILGEELGALRRDPTAVRAFGTAEVASSIAIYPTLAIGPNAPKQDEPTDCPTRRVADPTIRRPLRVPRGETVEVLDVMAACGDSYRGPYVVVRTARGETGYAQPEHTENVSIPARPFGRIVTFSPAGAYKAIQLESIKCEASLACAEAYYAKPYERLVRDYPGSYEAAHAADILVKRYEGFADFLEQARRNPNVLASDSQQLYRERGEPWLAGEIERYRGLAQRFREKPARAQ